MCRRIVNVVKVSGATLYSILVLTGSQWIGDQRRGSEWRVQRHARVNFGRAVVYSGWLYSRHTTENYDSLFWSHRRLLQSLLNLLVV